MADDPNPALRAELQAALNVLAPQIRGLHDIEHVSLSDSLIVAVKAEITEREQRRDLIQAVIDSLDNVVTALAALEADGYPALPDTALPASMISELAEEVSDVNAAVSVFTADMASSMSVSLGESAPKG